LAAAAPQLAAFLALGGPEACDASAAFAHAEAKSAAPAAGAAAAGKVAAANGGWGGGVRGWLLGRALGSGRRFGGGAARHGGEWARDEKERWCAAFARRETAAADASKGRPSSSSSSRWSSGVVAVGAALWPLLTTQSGLWPVPAAPEPAALALALHDSPVALAAWHLEKAAALQTRRAEAPPAREGGAAAAAEAADAGSAAASAEAADEDRRGGRGAAARDGGEPGVDWLAANLHLAWFHPGGAAPPLRLHRASFGSPDSRTWRRLIAGRSVKAQPVL
jgi:hypothetical protein